MNRGFTPAAPPPNLLYLKVIIFNCTYWRGANQIVITYPDRDIHVVLDNLNTHKRKKDRWLKRHPRVHLHFIPTYSSWLNQVECWFSILGQQALQEVSFTSPEQLREAIDKFVKAYNKKAAPFEWSKAVVHPTAPKRKYADLCN